MLQLMRTSLELRNRPLYAELGRGRCRALTAVLVVPSVPAAPAFAGSGVRKVGGCGATISSAGTRCCSISSGVVIVLELRVSTPTHCTRDHAASPGCSRRDTVPGRPGGRPCNNQPPRICIMRHGGHCQAMAIIHTARQRVLSRACLKLQHTTVPGNTGAPGPEGTSSCASQAARCSWSSSSLVS